MHNHFLYKILELNIQKSIALGFTNSGKWDKKVILKDLYAFNITIKESYFRTLFKNLIANKSLVARHSIDCGLR